MAASCHENRETRRGGLQRKNGVNANQEAGWGYCEVWGDSEKLSQSGLSFLMGEATPLLCFGPFNRFPIFLQLI